MSQEKERLEQDRMRAQHWRKWGPYLSERQWGTVREDYSDDEEVWLHCTFDEAKSKVYRWGEDGIAGISDNHQKLCLAFAFWNGEDPILKERLFGVSGKQGNHGEDVKEYYFYLDNTPLHSYMKYLYKYPQSAFPYAELIEENKRRGLKDFEYELMDTGILKDDRYFDITVEYAKVGPEDLLIRLTAVGRGPEVKQLHVLPTLWFRNTWSFGKPHEKPNIQRKDGRLEAGHVHLGSYSLYFEKPEAVWFTENETGRKDAFHRYLIGKEKNAVSDAGGTKAALHYTCDLGPGQVCQFHWRLTKDATLKEPFADFERLFAERKADADLFYGELLPPHLPEDLRHIQRAAFAGLLWNKQFYHYVVEEWLKTRRSPSRNKDWPHLYNDDVLSVPDKWEYPCFFSWDTAFHTVPLALIDPEFAKRQLTLLTREWYMHPNGQLPAHEWSFSDVNPPVHAWAAWRVYKIEKKTHHRTDRHFLESVFQKLLLNFTWWVNRKDADGRNIFQGGFLGLDNISVFNRSEQLPLGGQLYQSDATSWMGMYCLNMLTIALELAKDNPSYEDMASKFYEHFLHIADAINHVGERDISLWNEEDGFYYDVLKLPDGRQFPLKVRSLVGLVPMFAVATLEPEVFAQFKGFDRRVEWFLNHRGDLCEKVASMRAPGVGNRRLLSLVHRERLKRVLSKMLDEAEFLSPYGIRSLSKYHEEHPYALQLDGHEYRVDYEPAESTTKLFGGNSNWRGPIWFPLNMLIIESLQKFHHYYGDSLKVEFPTGSGKWMDLWDVSKELSLRLARLFLKDEKGHRPIYGGNLIFQEDPHWKDYLLFYEYFHGDNGAGLGASHQTGWTGLVAKLVQQYCQYHFNLL
jgi:hypothetical protein